MSTNARGRRILVTGAGGWLGGEIARRLAARGDRVTALVRRRNSVLGNDGQDAAVDRVLAGDVAEERLGWPMARWREVASSHDLVIHCAALTQFGADWDVAHRVNVGGTAQVVALAEAGGMGVLHMSTAYVNGGHSAEFEETAVPIGPFTNAYEGTKAEAEAIVRAGNAPFVIARPGIVVGDWTEGRVREFSTFYLLLKALAEGKVRQMPAAPGATLDLVPVDHVACGVVDLVDRFASASSGTFHLVSGAPTPVTAFPDMLSRFPGLAIPELVRPEAFAGFTSRLADRLVAPYAPYFNRAPRFDDRRFRALTGRACPEIGPGWWARLIRFALDSGFIQASRVGRNGIASEGSTSSSAGSR